jgi:hypothetical protein
VRQPFFLRRQKWPLHQFAPISDASNGWTWVPPAAFLEQLRSDFMRDCTPGAKDQIIRHSQIEPVRRLEVGMSGECHHVILAHTLAKPVGDGRLPQIVKRPGRHLG